MEQSHRHRTIYTSSSGIITQCRCCGSISIAFGNLLINLEASAIAGFCALIRKREKKHRHDTGHPNLRYIIISTAHSGISLMLTRRELRQLKQMLEESYPQLDLSYDRTGFKGTARREKIYLN